MCLLNSFPFFLSSFLLVFIRSVLLLNSFPSFFSPFCLSLHLFSIRSYFILLTCQFPYDHLLFLQFFPISVQYTIFPLFQTPIHYFSSVSFNVHYSFPILSFIHYFPPISGSYSVYSSQFIQHTLFSPISSPIHNFSPLQIPCTIFFTNFCAPCSIFLHFRHPFTIFPILFPISDPMSYFFYPFQ